MREHRLPTVGSLLGAQIGELAQDFLSTRKANISGPSNTFHARLAPCYGTLKEGSGIDLEDKELTTIISVTTKIIGRMAPAERTWDGVVAALQQNPVLQQMGDEIRRTDEYSLRSFTLLAGDGTPDQIAMDKVKAWFEGFIADGDVLESTKIDIGWCEYAVCQTGAAVKNMWEVLAKTQKVQRELVDIGVLRYPSQRSPYFKVFRIQLNVWADTKRVLTVQNDNNGVRGEFTCRRYQPCPEVINRLSERIIRRCIEEVNALFRSSSPAPLSPGGIVTSPWRRL